MDIFHSLRIAASGLTSQRLRLDVISNNIANANTTRTEEGGAYKRESVVFRPREGQAAFHLPVPAFVAARHGTEVTPQMSGVQVSKIVQDDTPGQRVYQPDHPDADADGYVTYPNVNIATEMTDMLSATRSYEANVTVLNAIKSMAMRALDIGRL